MKIRDHVDVVSQPTVVRLEQLHEAEPAWISDSYYITDETDKHLRSVKALLSKDTGCGIFLVGHYGSGKSHFLAYLAQQLEGGSFAPRKPGVLPISLLHYKAAQSLESIIEESLAIVSSKGDRRPAWKKVAASHPHGLVLIIDELSEFLRSKPSAQSFNEDLRFLQFLGEWAQHHELWILAALQEQIEHTGDIEYDLFRKIKDRYPVRLLLTTVHVKDLIAHRILRKKPSYTEAVEKLAKGLAEVYPDLAYSDLCEIYPLHPSTLELLEEVRDRFSQARGIIDFTLTQLLGSEPRGTPPFLDEPWGQLITPDRIIDHFADLFEVQPEFLAIAQKVLPYFRRQIPALLEKKPQQDLAWRLLKLLMLVHLSPRRSALDVEESARWLTLKATALDPARNREVIKRLFELFVEQGSYVKRHNKSYKLDLEDDSKENLDRLLRRAVSDLEASGDAVFECLVPYLQSAEFNPFAMPRDRWHVRKVRWHFHDRDLPVYFGGGVPPDQKAPALQIGLPWGVPPEGRHCYHVIPGRLERTPEILELAALHYLNERPLDARVLERVQERIKARTPWLCSLVRAAYNEAAAIDPGGIRCVPPLDSPGGSLAAWLQSYGTWVLGHSYPQFEGFAPRHGPLPKEAYRQFMKFALDNDLGAENAPDYVKLIREAYLVPMGLLQRRGMGYGAGARPDRHELVKLLAPILEHHPTPERVYEHLSAPVYGLVPDQIHLLLLTLLVQGEIEILKDQHSYRETYETLWNPLQYDRVVPARALSTEKLHDLELLCETFQIPLPKQWTVAAQKRAIEQLRKFGSRQKDQFADFLLKLRGEPDTGELVAQIQKLISQWMALEKGEHEIQGFEHFLFAAGSPQRFAAEVREISALPARFDKLLGDTRRYVHLFHYPCVRECALTEVTVALEALASPPSLAQPEVLETWLAEAAKLYRKYGEWYRKEHERWRRGTEQHAIWNYRLPAISRSKHLALAETVREIEVLLAKARQEQCSGLSGLDFQPMCRCGFNGKQGPLDETLRRFEEASDRLERDLTLFFQQDKVKTRIHEWVDQKLELLPRTLSYLEGSIPYPEVGNVALLDQHLSGLELVRAIRADALLDFVAEQTWEKSSLMRALDRFFERAGPRIVLRREERGPRRELVAWCCEQALKQGCALPPGLSAAEQELIADLIQPQWIGEESLRNLESIGVGEDAIRRILEMLLDGFVRAPEPAPPAGPVAAAMELLLPRRPESAEELAQRIAVLYEQNDRFLRLRPQAWLSRLEQLADARFDPAPRSLQEVLYGRLEDQWVIIDCLGLPLLGLLRELLPSILPGWELEDVVFGLSAQASSTDAFYRDLLNGEIKKSFEKINAVDNLIHTRGSDFGDLRRLARAELEIAFKRLILRLDSTRSLIIFGDHGFRLSLDGRSFSHGGPSTLERLVPVLRLRPL